MNSDFSANLEWPESYPSSYSDPSSVSFNQYFGSQAPVFRTEIRSGIDPRQLYSTSNNVALEYFGSPTEIGQPQPRTYIQGADRSCFDNQNGLGRNGIKKCDFCRTKRRGKCVYSDENLPCDACVRLRVTQPCVKEFGPKRQAKEANFWDPGAHSSFPETRVSTYKETTDSALTLQRKEQEIIGLKNTIANLLTCVRRLWSSNWNSEVVEPELELPDKALIHKKIFRTIQNIDVATLLLESLETHYRNTMIPISSLCVVNCGWPILEWKEHEARVTAFFQPHEDLAPLSCLIMQSRPDFKGKSISWNVARIEHLSGLLQMAQTYFGSWNPNVRKLILRNEGNLEDGTSVQIRALAGQHISELLCYPNLYLRFNTTLLTYASRREMISGRDGDRDFLCASGIEITA